MGGRGSSGGNNPGGSKATAKSYHVNHTDSAGGEYIDSGTINGKTIGNKTSLEYGGENRTGTIVGAHKYPNGKVDFTVRMDETKFSKAVTKTVSENRLKNTPANKSKATGKSVSFTVQENLGLGSTIRTQNGEYIAVTGMSAQDRGTNINNLKKTADMERHFTEDFKMKSSVGNSYTVTREVTIYKKEANVKGGRFKSKITKVTK